MSPDTVVLAFVTWAGLAVTVGSVSVMLADWITSPVPAAHTDHDEDH